MMLNRLNHIAIVVPDLNKAVENYKNAFNVNISKKIDLPKHGVSTVFIEMSNANIELLEPLGQNSPIKNFLIKNPIGGMHHLCYEVENIVYEYFDLSLWSHFNRIYLIYFKKQMKASIFLYFSTFSSKMTNRATRFLISAIDLGPQCTI